MDALAVLRAAFQTPWFSAILGLLALNVATGVAAAVYTRTFAIGALADWLETRALPLVLTDGVFQVVLRLVVGDPVVSGAGLTQPLGDAIHLAVILALVGKTLANLAAMGLSLPAALTDVPRGPNHDPLPTHVGGAPQPTPAWTPGRPMTPLG